MGTVAEKITYLGETKTKLKNSINSLGADLTDESTFRSYATALDTFYEELPKVTGAGSSVTLENTKKGRLSTEPLGKSSQESTSGKQLLDLQDITITVAGVTATISKGHVTLKGTNTSTSSHTIIMQRTNLPTFEIGKTYTISKYKITNGIYSQFVYYNGTTNLALGYQGDELRVTFTIPNDFVALTSYQIYVSGTATNIDVDFDLMLVEGSYTASTMPEFEIFSGGQPAPSPDYPYPIKDVTGDNEIEVQNKNLFDKEDVIDGKTINSDGTLGNNSSYSTSNLRKILPNAVMTLSGMNWGRIAFYDKNSNFISYLANNQNSTITFTTPENAEYYRISTTTDTLNVTQLEKGSSATPYIEHKSQSHLLSLGVENLYVGSQDFSGTWENSGSWETDDLTYNGLVVKKKKIAWGGLYKEINVEANKTYTFSVYAKADTSRSVVLYFAGGTATSDSPSKTLTISTEWRRYYVTLTVSGSGTVRCRVENTTNDTGYTYICGYQLEEGPVAHSYSPYGQEPIHLRGIGDYRDSIRRSSGKNLVEDTIENANVTSNGAIGSVTGYDLHIAKVVQGKTYTASTDDAQLVCGFFANYPTINMATYDNTRTVQNSKTITAPITGYIAFRSTTVYKSAQLEEGYESTSPEPYGEGVWYVQKKVRKLELAIADMNNGENYPGWKNVNPLLTDYPNKNTLVSIFTSFICNITNHPRVLSINTLNVSQGGVLFINVDVQGFNLIQSEWKEQYPDLVLELEYGLQEPDYETITSETLINQLNELYYAYSYEGQTNVFVESGEEDEQMELNISALEDVNKRFEILTNAIISLGGDI